MGGINFLSHLFASDSKLGHHANDEPEDRIDVDKPLWDQESYCGRWKHIAFITDCRTILAPRQKLCNAKQLCEDYKNGVEPKETKREDVIYAKKLRDSAFHPYTGELVPVIGRMSFQLPGGLVLTTAMLTFYKSAASIIGCQLAYQSFNAIVNYTNRNAKSDIPDDGNVITQAFVFATSASCAAALAFRKLLSCRSPVFERWVPFGAVVAGNIVNLPIIRQREIIRGIPISEKNKENFPIMNSSVAGIKGISECVFARIVLSAPSLIMIPIITQKMRSYCFYRSWMRFPVELGLTALSYVFQKSSVH